MARASGTALNPHSKALIALSIFLRSSSIFRPLSSRIIDLTFGGLYFQSSVSVIQKIILGLSHQCIIMAKVSVDVPDNLKKRIEETAEKKDYKSSSEYIREALRNQLEKDEEVDVELLYRYMKLEKGEGLEKASSVDEVRKRING